MPSIQNLNAISNKRNSKEQLLEAKTVFCQPPVAHENRSQTGQSKQQRNIEQLTKTSG